MQGHTLMMKEHLSRFTPGSSIEMNRTVWNDYDRTLFEQVLSVQNDVFADKSGINKVPMVRRRVIFWIFD